MANAILVAVDTIAAEVKLCITTAKVQGALCKHLHDHHCFIRYRALASPLGMFSAGLGKYLGRIQDEDHANARPLLSSLVVGADGRPSAGYFEHARSLGYKIPRDKISEEDFWAEQLRVMGVATDAPITSV